jgi:hypothetical protein
VKNNQKSRDSPSEIVKTIPSDSVIVLIVDLDFLQTDYGSSYIEGGNK